MIEDVVVDCLRMHVDEGTGVSTLAGCLAGTSPLVELKVPHESADFFRFSTNRRGHVVDPTLVLAEPLNEKVA